MKPKLDAANHAQMQSDEPKRSCAAPNHAKMLYSTTSQKFNTAKLNRNAIEQVKRNCSTVNAARTAIQYTKKKRYRAKPRRNLKE